MKKTQKLVFVAGLAACVAAPVSAQVLYNNGTANGGAAPYGLGTTATHSTGAAAPTGYQWSELQLGPGAISMNVLGFGAQFATSTNRIADDFTVTGGGWNITTVSVFGYLTASATTTSPIDGCSLQIWNGKPGDATSTVVWGDATTNRFASATQAFALRTGRAAGGTTRAVWKADITVGTTLPAGTYWLDFQVGNSVSGGFSPPVTIAGSAGPATANALQFTTAYLPLVDTGPAATPFPVPVPCEAPFIVNGTPAGGNTCYANCDASTNPPCLNVNDFVCFNNLYSAGSALANCDGSTNPPILNVNDFVCFNNKYSAGCVDPCAAP